MKTVFITGGNKGIGLETARQLAQAGYYVYIGCRDKTRGLEALRALKESGLSNIRFLQIDVSDIHSVKAAGKVLQSEIDTLDILINNAGIAGGQPQNISSVEIDRLREIFDVNFFGVIQITQCFLPLLRNAAAPRIVNVSSQLGSLGFQSETQNPNHLLFDAYSASKTALNAFTVHLAKELRNTKFKVISVAPGYTATDLNQHKGTQSVEQAARIVVRYATIPAEEMPGLFLGENGTVSW